MSETRGKLGASNREKLCPKAKTVNVLKWTSDQEKTCSKFKKRSLVRIV